MEFAQRNKILVALVLFLSIMGGIIYFSQGGYNAKPGAQAPGAEEKENIKLAQGCVSIDDAANYVGEEACVSGKLIKVFTSKSGTTFLDFCENYQACPFTAVIFKGDFSKFDDLKIMENKIVQIRGLIKTYKGKPEIIINDPVQIKIAQ